MAFVAEKSIFTVRRKIRKWSALALGPLFALAFYLPNVLPAQSWECQIYLSAAVITLNVYVFVWLASLSDTLASPVWLRNLVKLNWKTYLILAGVLLVAYVVLKLYVPFGTKLLPAVLTMTYIAIFAWCAGLAFVLAKHGKDLKQEFGLYPVLLIAVACFAFVAYAWVMTASYQSTLLAMSAMFLALSAGLLCNSKKAASKERLRAVSYWSVGAFPLWAILNAIWPSDWNAYYLVMVGLLTTGVSANVVRRESAKRLESTVYELQERMRIIKEQLPLSNKSGLDPVDGTLLQLRKQILEYREDGILDPRDE
ncbi:MAG TPA: hypothetical protein V6D17_12745 [Candidatus Obscuribacterales bacterium]